MDHEIDSDSIYQNIGVTPVINAAGPITMFGGTKLRPEVHSAMNAASQTMIDLHQLNDKAGEILASYAGAEAGMVTSGSAGALILQAAAVVAGSAGLGHQKRQGHLVERIERVESPNSRCGILAANGEWKIRKQNKQKSLFTIPIVRYEGVNCQIQ